MGLIRIALDGSFDETASQDLSELQEKLRENGVAVSSSGMMVPGVKVELIIGLTIASLTLASISTLINVINFWKSQRSTAYRISFETLQGSEPITNEVTPALADAIKKDHIIGIKIEKA